MLKYIVKRLLNLIPVIFIISIVIFGTVKGMPGDPVDAYLGMGSKATPEQKQQIREELGLDKSLPEQYVIWVGNLAKGELGTSTKFKLPVSEIIGDYVWNTFLLNLVSLVIGIGLSIPIGIKQATKKFSKFDNFWTVFSLCICANVLLCADSDFLRSAAFRRDTGQRYAYPGSCSLRI